MKKIILPREKGKTTELIKMAHEEELYIITPTKSSALMIFEQARSMGLDILFPISWEEYKEHRLRGSGIKEILIDDAEIIIEQVFRGLRIKAITMTGEVIR